MSDIVTPVLQWLNQHPQLAGLATFCISAAESVAIIGSIVPGSLMMSAIGALAGAGIVPLWPIVMWAILGAIAGDGMSYWMGYYFKDRLRDMWPFNRWPNILATGESFFEKHGGKSVFIGRFVGPVRAIVPVIAGMLDFAPLRFTIANVTSAIFWAPIYMLPGFLLGAASLELPPDITIHLITILFIYALLFVFTIWFIATLSALIGRRVNALLNWIWARLKISRYFHLVTTVLKHHDKRKTHGQLVLAFYFIVLSAIFLHFLAYVFLKNPQSILINNSLFYFFRTIRTPAMDTVMFYITLLGEKTILIPVVLILFGWLAWTKRWHTAWHVLALSVLTIGVIETLKLIVREPRPLGIIGNYHASFSFPSGHSTLAITFYLGLCILLVGVNNKKINKFMYAFTALIIGAIGLSRLYLGAHWLTDVIGGLLLGSLLLMFVALSYNRKAEENLRPLGVLMIIIFGLILSYTFFYRHSIKDIKRHYTMIEWPTHKMTLQDWWQQQDQHIPLYRINRFGSSELFAIEWVGDLTDIKRTLLANGWEESPKRDWLSIIYRITNVKSTEHLPLVSPIHLDKNPVLVLVKHLNNSKKMLVLRFWDSYTKLIDSSQPLWVGSIEIISGTYSWLFHHKDRNTLDLTPDLVFIHTIPRYDIKTLAMTLNSKKRHPSKAQSIIFIKPRS